jgi:hypothetical protein
MLMISCRRTSITLRAMPSQSTNGVCTGIASLATFTARIVFDTGACTRTNLATYVFARDRKCQQARSSKSGEASAREIKSVRTRFSDDLVEVGRAEDGLDEIGRKRVPARAFFLRFRSKTADLGTQLGLYVRVLGERVERPCECVGRGFVTGNKESRDLTKHLIVRQPLAWTSGQT